MGIFDTAFHGTGRDDPLNARAAGRVFTMKLLEHARVRESAPGAAAARRPRGGARRHRYFDDEDAYGASTALAPAATEPPAEGEEDEEENGAGEEVVYESNGRVAVDVHLDEEVRECFIKVKHRHKDPVGQPQEWFGIIVPNRTLRARTAPNQTSPPKGWIQDGREGHDSQEAKGQCTLILVLKGAINELITNTDIPESQKEQLTEILGVTQTTTSPHPATSARRRPRSGGSGARAREKERWRNSPNRERPRPRRRWPGSHGSASRRCSHTGPRCRWQTGTCQRFHAPSALEVASLWLMQDATDVSEWEVPVRPKILWDELCTAG